MPQEDRTAARQKADQVALKLKEMKLAEAAELVRGGIEETLFYYAFPREHWRCLRTNNPLERLLREVRRRTRAVGAFPDGKSALMLAAARLRHVAGTKWGTRRYLDNEPNGRRERGGMTVRANTFGSPSGEPSITITRPMPHKMCEKSWTLPPPGASARRDLARHRFHRRSHAWPAAVQFFNGNYHCGHHSDRRYALAMSLYSMDRIPRMQGHR